MLHGLIAEALGTLATERGSGGRAGWVAGVAYDVAVAEIGPKGLECAEQAGEQARRLYAPRATIEHLSRAIEAAHRVGAPPTAFYRTRGQMHETLGAFEAALLAADQSAGLRGLRPIRWRIQASLGKLYQGQAR